MTLSKARKNIGKEVVYHGGWSEEEYGVIYRVNKTYIFVQFRKEGIHLDEFSFSPPISCNTWDLTLRKEWNKMKRWSDILDD